MVRTIAKDYDTKREKILTAAAHVFAHNGVASASMAEVAKACGISKGNIYHYYASKLAILFKILDSYLTRLRGRLIITKLDSGNVQGSLEKICTEILTLMRGWMTSIKFKLRAFPYCPKTSEPF